MHAQLRNRSNSSNSCPSGSDLFRIIGGSALTDDTIDVPSARDGGPDADATGPLIPVTYVPFRNAHFLSAAVSWAEVLGAKNHLYRRRRTGQFPAIPTAARPTTKPFSSSFVPERATETSKFVRRSSISASMQSCASALNWALHSM